jgi:hypothetical protein
MVYGKGYSSASSSVNSLRDMGAVSPYSAARLRMLMGNETPLASSKYFRGQPSGGMISLTEAHFISEFY